MESNPMNSSIPMMSLAVPDEHQMQQGARYAPFWRRFAAYLVDSCVFGVALGVPAYVVLIFVFVGHIAEMKAHPDPNQVAGFITALVGIYLVVLAVAMIAAWLYYALMESSSKQGTLGKMAVGIVVTDLDGNRITFGRASGRFFGRILSALILDIGFIMAAFTEKKQALHDMMAGTIVLLDE